MARNKIKLTKESWSTEIKKLELVNELKAMLIALFLSIEKGFARPGADSKMLALAKKHLSNVVIDFDNKLYEVSIFLPKDDDGYCFFYLLPYHPYGEFIPLNKLK